MKVKMLAATYWDGKRLKAGATTEVDNKTGARWEQAGIAKAADGQKPPGEEKPIEKMNTEQLTQKAAVLGVDISACTTNQQRVDAIKAHLEPANGGNADGAGQNNREE